MGISRKDLIAKKGEVVEISYNGLNDKECFGIGWFFQLTEQSARLKVTSTKGDSYECMNIDVDRITAISAFQID